jgi:NitT/TauT family transport system substrate-binding protein
MAKHFKLSTLLSAFALGSLLLLQVPAQAADKVTYGTNWLAQAEHGGFYQAIADGTYAKYGLEVTIVQGGPNAANSALLKAGKIDFYMGGPAEEISGVVAGVPIMDVAAIFQKEPQVLMAHPDSGVEKFEDLAKLPTLFMGKDLYISAFEWMKATYPGFKDEQYKPYNFNPAPFIADKMSGQQGYLTSEPYEIEKQAGWKPKVFLLADAGYAPYSTMITTQTDLIMKNPDLVQRFVDASIEGWYNYLYGDNAKANELIKKDNPEMTDGQLAYSLAKLKEYGIVDSGDSLTKGIGCITDERYKAFYDSMVAVKFLPAGVDLKKAYTNQFVCKGVGLALKK